MTEDMFVQMLLEAAGGAVADERDVHLAHCAGSWALQHGWRTHQGDGFVVDLGGLQYWVSASAPGGALVILSRVAGSHEWHAHARTVVAHLGHALDFLVTERLLEARFCPASRRALEDLAQAHDRTANMLRLAAEDDTEELDDSSRIRLLIQADAFHEAATSARRFAGAPLAVLT